VVSLVAQGWSWVPPKEGLASAPIHRQVAVRMWPTRRILIVLAPLLAIGCTMSEPQRRQLEGAVERFEQAATRAEAAATEAEASARHAAAAAARVEAAVNQMTSADDPRELSVERSGIRVDLKAAPFVPAKHRVQRCSIGAAKVVCLIDGRPVFGTDGELPDTMLSRATVTLDTRRIGLDVSSMYQPRLGDHTVTAERSESGCIVRACLSDGAGAYVAEWRVVAGVPMRTILSGDEKLIAVYCNQDGGASDQPAVRE
jgi:hypothetical protein